jgi:hypothetical protein
MENRKQGDQPDQSTDDVMEDRQQVY